MGFFVKVRTSLRHHQLLQRCSFRAQVLFRICLEIAGDYEQGDALALRGPNGPIPLTVAEIAHEAGAQWTARQAAYALGELMEIGLIELRQPECYFIPKFTEKTAVSDAERAALYRHRHNFVTESVTDSSRKTSRQRDESRHVSRDRVRDTSLPTVEKKRVRPVVDSVTFDAEDEPLVSRLVANDAAENKSGEISVGRLANLRATLKAALDKHGIEVWRYGCDIAAGKSLGVRYAIGVMRNYRPGEAASPLFSASQDEPRHPTRAEIWRAQAEAEGISFEEFCRRQEAQRAGA